MPNCSSACCSSCSIRSAAWALATSSRCSASVSAVILALSSLTSLARLGQRLGALLAFGGQLVAGARRPRRRPRSAARRPGGPTRRPRPPPPRHARAPRGPAARAAVASRSAAAARRSESARPRTAFARSSAVRTASRASTSAARAASAAAIDSWRSTGSASNIGACCGVVQPGLELGRAPRRSASGPASSSSRCCDQPLPLVVGGAGVLPEPAQLLVDRRDRGVGFVERGQRLLGGVLAGRLLGERTRQRGRQLAGLPLGGGQLARAPSRSRR